MNKEIVILRQAITKLIPMIAGKGLKVTQIGTRAYVAPHPVTGLPYHINIPCIPDNAEPEFIFAIQGFIDHEVGHVLCTDFLFKAKDKSKRLHNLHNLLEDTYVERRMGEMFPGSRKNIAQLRSWFAEKITQPAVLAAKSQEEQFGYLLVGVLRALSGQREFQDFLDDNKYWDHPLVEALMKRLPQSFKDGVPHLSSTEETYRAAVELEAILYPPPPPAPPQPEPQDEEQDDQDSQSGDQDTSDQESEEDHSDEEQSSEDGEGKGEREHKEDSENASGGEDDEDSDPQDDDEGEGADGEEPSDEGEPGESEDEGDSGKDGKSDDPEDEADEGKGKGDAESGDDEDQADQSSGSSDDASDEERSNGEDDDADDASAGAGDDEDGDDGQTDGDEPKSADNSEAGDQDEKDEAGEDGGDDDQSAADDGESDAGDSGDDDEADRDAQSEDGSSPGAGGDEDDDEGEDGDEAEGSNNNLAVETDSDDDTEAASEDDENKNEVAGVGYDGPNPFDELTDEDVADKDLSASIVVMIQKEAIEACREADYTVYTREYDMIEPYPTPKDWNAGSYVTKLEDEVRSMTGVMQKDIERMMAAQSRVFNVGGQRSGKLNGPGLHRLIAGDARIFSQRHEITAKDTAVSLLIDNSGSMKGEKAALATTAGYALSSVLERVNIPHECLGFTTGGMWTSNERFNREAMEKLINDYDEEQRKTGIQFCRVMPIYMPIFKDFNERINSDVKKRFAHFRAKQPNMGGNIDGESLEYAAMRLVQRKEKRKVIMVLSDGHPAGAQRDAEHLRMMTTKLMAAGIDLVGIGIMDDAVSRFYDNHIVLDDIAKLPGAVMTELRKILTK